MLSAPSVLPRAWLTVALLWVVGCLNYLDRVMITTMRGSVLETIPMTEAQFGLLTTIFLWVYGGLSPFAGFLADRLSRTRVIVASLLIWSLVTWLTAHAKTFEQLFVTRALMGVSEACYIPAALALIADYHRGNTRSLANGIHLCGALFGSSLGGLGGWMAERQGWQFAFSLFGGVGVAYALVLQFFLRDAPAEPAAEPAGAATAPPVDSAGAAERIRLGAALASLLARRAFLIALAYWGLLGLAGWALIGWMPSYLGEHFHLAQGRAGLFATGFSNGAMILGMLMGGVWADRWSRTNERARIFVPMIGLCVAAPCVWLVSITPVLPVALAGLAVYGLARAFADGNMMPILCTISDPRYRATGYGILNFFGTLVGGAAIYVGGRLRDGHVEVSRMFQFAAGGLGLCVLLLALIKPQPAPAAPVVARTPQKVL